MTKFKFLITAVFAVVLLALPATASAHRRDSDRDGMPDRWEKAHDLKVAKDDAKKDPDKDGVSNRSEFRHHTDPHKADTDGDGIDDGDEIRDGSRADDRNEISGTIQSFDSATGVLTLLLPDGKTTRSGTVDSSTRIECENESELHKSDHGSGSGSGDRSGRGDGSGEDRSGPGGGDSGDEAEAEGCTTADLVPGTVVKEAKLATASGGGTVFTKLELDK